MKTFTTSFLWVCDYLYWMCSTQRYFISMVRLWQETLFSSRVFKQSSLTPFKLPCILWVEFRYGNMILSLVCKYRTIHSIVIRSSYFMGSSIFNVHLFRTAYSYCQRGKFEFLCVCLFVCFNYLEQNISWLCTLWKLRKTESIPWLIRSNFISQDFKHHWFVKRIKS